MSTSKICSKCLQEKASSEFYKYTLPSGKIGIRPWCKACVTSDTNSRTAKRKASGDVRAIAAHLRGQMVRRHKQGGYPGEVEWSSVEIAQAIQGNCAKTGLPFQLKPTPGTAKNPFMASPDRIDNTLGYTKENVQWVCLIYNFMHNCFSDSDVSKFIEALRK